MEQAVLTAMHALDSTAMVDCKENQTPETYVPRLRYNWTDIITILMSFFGNSCRQLMRLHMTAFHPKSSYFHGKSMSLKADAKLVHYLQQELGRFRTVRFWLLWAQKWTLGLGLLALKQPLYGLSIAVTALGVADLFSTWK